MTKGSIELRGQRIDQLPPGDLVAMGMVQVMEGRHCFGHLGVEDNLITGACSRPIKGTELRDELERVYTYFPELKARRTSLAGYTSGGEQQMVAIGRAMMAKSSAVAGRAVDGPRSADRGRNLRDRSRSEPAGGLEQNTNP